MGPVVDWLAVVGAGVGASRLGAGERGGGGHIAYGEHVAVLQSLNAACSTIGVYISLGVCGGEALAEWLAQAPATLAGPLGDLRVIAASERLAMLARAQGFRRVTVAASARPADLLAAIDAA